MDLTEKPSAEDTIGERVVNFLERSNKIFINIIKFFAALFLLMVVFNFFHWMYFAEDGMMIEPFEINLESRNMSGMLLADQLCCEINDIYKINSVYSAIPKSRIFDKPDDNYNIQQMYSKSPYVDQSISQIGTVGLEGTSISVGNLLLSLRELSGTHRNTLAVQFGRYGSNVNMVAVLGDSSWDVSRNLTQFNQSIEELTPGMMNEMAFKITFETCENRSKLKPMNWETFKNLICGQEAYNEYFLTKNASHIRRAQDFIQLAIQNEPNYLGSYELLFEIGMAYYRTGNYDNAETIFKNTSQARPLESAIALGHLHLCKQNYRKSLAFFNKAIYIDPDYAEAWEGKATSLKFLGLYNDLFMHLKKQSA